MRFGRSIAGASVSLACFALALSCASKNSGSSEVNPGSGSPSVASTGGSGATGAGGSAGSTGKAEEVGPSLNLDGAADTVPASVPDAGATLPDGEVCGTTCPAGQSTCAPEICDGIDNNCDGNIDNVDKNGDGVCDCVLIATLGVPGTSGVGDVFSTWLSTRSNNGATALGDQTLTPELLAKYEVVVSQNVSKNHAYTPAEVQALQDWVTNGGGFMTLIGFSSPTEVVNVNTLLQPFGMNYGNVAILRKPPGGSTVPVTQWVPHPVDLGVTAVGVDNGYEVQGTGTMFAMGGGYNVGNAQQVSKGHVLMWGDEWITYDSEWTMHPDYQVQLFWLNAIKWLTVQGTCQIPIPPSLGGIK